MAQEINWFPGHMRKSLNETSERVKLVDVVYETCDARIPFSSRNPELSGIVSNKPRIVVLNKCDLADPNRTAEWMSYFDSVGVPAVEIDANHKKGLDKLTKLTLELVKDKLDKAKEKGRIGRPVRVMVAGVPNTGKSTLINALCKRKATITGDRPGVTRSSSWVKTDYGFDLMDMPGVLWPKIASKRMQLCLTATGAIKSEVTDSVEVAFETIKLIDSLYPNAIPNRYNVDEAPDPEDINACYDRFLEMAKKRGCILSGGRIDEERFSVLFLDDFRQARIGRLSLEIPMKG